jgi:O-antigen ligase
MLLLLIPLGSHLVVRREHLRIDRTSGLLLLFLAVLLIASVNSMDMGLAMERVLTFALEGILLYLLLTNVVRTLPALRRVIWTLLAAGSLLGAMSLYQEVTGDFARQFGGLAHRNYDFMVLEASLAETPDDPVLLEQKARMRDNRSRRAEGPMDEPNGYAQIMIVLLPLALFTYRTAASSRARLSAALAGALILGGMITSMSRGAMLAFGVLLIAAAAVRWIRRLRLLVVVLLLAAAAPFVASDRFVQRLTSIGSAVSLLRGDGTDMADHAIRGRATEMMAAMRVFADHPLLGVGPGQYAPFYSAEYHQNDPRFQFRSLGVSRRAHSLYLEIGAELGIAGLVVFLAIVATLMRDLWRERNRCSLTRPDLAHLSTALWLSLLAYLTTGVFLHLMYERYFWMLLAIAGSALHVIRLHQGGHAPRALSQPPTAGT